MKKNCRIKDARTTLAYGTANAIGPFANPRRRGKRVKLEDVRRAYGLDGGPVDRKAETEDRH